jgi:hypothetical protein
MITNKMPQNSSLIGGDLNDLQATIVHAHKVLNEIEKTRENSETINVKSNQTFENNFNQRILTLQKRINKKNENSPRIDKNTEFLLSRYPQLRETFHNKRKSSSKKQTLLKSFEEQTIQTKLSQKTDHEDQKIRKFKNASFSSSNANSSSVFVHQGSKEFNTFHSTFCFESKNDIK